MFNTTPFSEFKIIAILPIQSFMRSGDKQCTSSVTIPECLNFILKVESTIQVGASHVKMTWSNSTVFHCLKS